MNEKAQRYPLSWPDGWKRAKSRRPAHFGKQKTEFDFNTGQTMYLGKSRLSIEEAFRRIEEELGRIGVDESTVVISTNLKTNMRGIPSGNRSEPNDPGVAVYWTRKKTSQCMAIDVYYRVADNLAAVAASLAALRAIERHGGAEILDRAFTGFAALPEKASSPWRDILEITSEHVSKGDVDSAFRRLAHQYHPDKETGDAEKFNQICRAREAAYLEVGA